MEPKKETRPSPVGSILRAEINRRGLTAYAVSKLAEARGRKVSIDTVHRFVTGERKGLSLTTVDALAEVLGLELVRAQGSD